jgi:hypothetical protein
VVRANRGSLVVVVAEKELVGAFLAAEEPSESPAGAILADPLEADLALLEPRVQV